MKTVNSLSGGKTSSYIAANYPADYNVFALVRTNDKKCMFPDKKIRQIVSDRIGKEFIGTLEMDTIIYTMLDLEQMIGKEINWVSGKTFDEVISTKNTSGKIFIPNYSMRFCTVDMKIEPISDWWLKTIAEVVEMRIGFRANETKRAKTTISKLNKNGNLEINKIVGQHKNGRKKWEIFEWQKPNFPLIKDNIYKDNIEEFWKDKPVRFASFNNCVGCFHRNPILLKHMSNKEPEKFDWFNRKEQQSLIDYDGKKIKRTWKFRTTYQQIKDSLEQLSLFDDDFDDCDSGYCGL